MLPSLQSFCVFAAVGILAVYFIQATWFVAWFTLDQRRIVARRDGLLPCYTHRRWTPNDCSQSNCFQNFFSRVYAPAVLSRPGKVRRLGTVGGVLPMPCRKMVRDDLSRQGQSALDDSGIWDTQSLLSSVFWLPVSIYSSSPYEAGA